MITKPRKVSIVIPSFNQANYINETLACLVHQQDITKKQLEIIVIDGGSTDGTLAIIERYAAQLDYVVSEPDRGQTHALIKGFAQATGDVLGWLCSDDLLEETTICEVLDYFESHSTAQFVYGDVLWIDQHSHVLRHGKEISFNWFIWIYGGNYIPQPATFWRRELYEQVGGLDEQYNLAMDADLWSRFAQCTQPQHVRRTWARVRLHPERKTQRMYDRTKAEDRRIRERLGASFHDSSSYGRLYVRMRNFYARGLRIVWKFITGGYL